jgi:hypothetical protein
VLTACLTLYSTEERTMEILLILPSLPFVLIAFALILLVIVEIKKLEKLGEILSSVNRNI